MGQMTATPSRCMRCGWTSIPGESTCRYCGAYLVFSPSGLPSVALPQPTAMRAARTGLATTKPVGAFLTIAGGAILVLGSVLPWATIGGTGGHDFSVAGIDAGAIGWLTLVAGVVVLLCGASLLARGVNGTATGLAALAGVVGGVIAIWQLVDLSRLAATVNLISSIGASPARGSLGVGIGLYAAVAGSVAAVAAVFFRVRD